MEIKSEEIQLTNNKVLVRPVTVEEKTESGIVIPDTQEEDRKEISQGIVIATGPGTWEEGKFIEPSVSEGDVVVYGKYSGATINWKGTKYTIMNSPEIFWIRHDVTDEEIQEQK